MRLDCYSFALKLEKGEVKGRQKLRERGWREKLSSYSSYHL